MAVPMLLINLYGAPGAGKSTTRAEVFSKLKKLDINCEEIPEVAKRFTWEKRELTMKSQPYLFGKQLRDTEILKGQVDVAITDSPLILSVLYGRKYADYPESFYDGVVDIANSFDSMNFFIERTKKYNPAGRNQTEEESDAIAWQLQHLLGEFKIPYSTISGPGIGDVIVNRILERLKFSD
jgi:hypothetical protein